MKYLILLFIGLQLLNCKNLETPKYSSEPMKVETLIGEEGETVV